MTCQIVGEPMTPTDANVGGVAPLGGGGQADCDIECCGSHKSDQMALPPALDNQVAYKVRGVGTGKPYEVAAPRRDGLSSMTKLMFVYLFLAFLLMVNYVWGIWTLFQRYGDATSAWGRIALPGNEWLLRIYYFGFAEATVGYFLNLNYIVRVGSVLPDKNVSSICTWFGVFFITEFAWLPMVVGYLRENRDWLFSLICLQLLCSGVAGIGWAYECAKLPHMASRVVRNLGVAGAIGFAAHCALLDALVWPPYFYGTSGVPLGRS